MSDVTIPGVTSKIDTKSMIEALMKPERAKLSSKKEAVETLKNQTTVWRDIRLALTRVQDSSKKLYGFQNPFNERLASSSDESIVTATATREATLDEKTITVKQIASTDRFKSGSLSKEFRVDPGTYRFRVGETEVEFAFKGGTLKDLAETINRKAGSALKATVVNDTRDTQIITIEALKTGGENKLVFLDQALEFGFKSAMLTAVHQNKLDVQLNPATVQYSGLMSPAETYNLSDGRLTLKPLAEGLRIPIDPGFAVTPEMVLEMTIDVKILEEKPWQPPPPPSGPELPLPGTAEFKGITIENEKSKVTLPAWRAPSPPQKQQDLHVLSMVSGEKQIDLPEISASGGVQKFKVPIGQISDRIDALNLSNKNTYREITISNISISDPTTRGDHKPLNALSEAQDAVILLDGIEIKRSSNAIDDLIPGVTLNLQGAADKPVNLSIKRDIERIKGDIIEFVGYYNRMLTKIDILSRNDPNVIEQAVFLNDEEKKEAAVNLGILQGETSLSRLKSRLRNTMLSPFRTSLGSDLTLLAQIGISTDSTRPGAGDGLDKSKLRGYLEIDEAKLEDALAKYPEGVRELFGYDTDKDFVIDTGSAYVVDMELRPYVQPDGIITTRLRTIDQTVQSRNRDIASYTRYLEDYEAKLRRKYGMMEGALKTLEQSSQTIDNFNKTNSR